MKIKDLIVGESDGLTAMVDYKEGIRFKLRFVSRQSLLNMSRNCTVVKYDEKTKVRAPTVDVERLTEHFCRRAVLGWSGVTPRSLLKIIPLDVSKIPSDQMDTELTFEQEELLSVVKNAYDLDTFLQEAATDIKVFKPELEDELKNSNSSQTGI